MRKQLRRFAAILLAMTLIPYFPVHAGTDLPGTEGTAEGSEVQISETPDDTEGSGVLPGEITVEDLTEEGEDPAVTGGSSEEHQEEETSGEGEAAEGESSEEDQEEEISEEGEAAEGESSEEDQEEEEISEEGEAAEGESSEEDQEEETSGEGETAEGESSEEDQEEEISEESEAEEGEISGEDQEEEISEEGEAGEGEISEEDQEELSEEDETAEDGVPVKDTEEEPASEGSADVPDEKAEEKEDTASKDGSAGKKIVTKAAGEVVGSGQDQTRSGAVPLVSISLRPTEKTLNKGGRCKLVVSYDPEDTTDDKTVKWSVGNSSIATVDSNGIVTGVGPGRTVVAATVGAYKAKCVITVKAPLVSISLKPTSKTLNKGSRCKLVVSYNPSDTTDSKTVKWTTGNSKIATVSGGIVTAKAPGRTVIAATVGSRTVKCVITVKAPLKGIRLNRTARLMKKGERVKLAVTYIPSDTTDSKTVKWSSSNSGIATVTSTGIVTAMSPGIAKITAKVGSKTAVFTVTVKSSVSPDYEYKTVNGRRIAVKHPALKYTYAVKPILSPFCYYIFVKTNNPDPTSFRFVDKTVETDGEYSAAFLPYTGIFADVKYEDASIYRVNGGYIFAYDNWTSPPDGGKLTLQVVNEGYYGWRYDDGGIRMRSGQEDEIYSDTEITVVCPRIYGMTDYLIRNYTDSSKGFFENMDSVQSFLDEMAVYPKYLVDTTKRVTDRPYPLLAASPYEELSLNDHYEIYSTHQGGLLLSAVYPFVLDSASFPGTMSAVARILRPSCKVESTAYHWLVDITYAGTTKTYGGAGTGSTNEIYLKHIQPTYNFLGTEGDYAAGVSLKTMRSRLISYGKKGDTFVASLEEKYHMTDSDILEATGNGTWVRIAKEGLFSFFDNMGYFIPEAPRYYYGISRHNVLSDAWVDGRYINTHEVWEQGAKFADHPNSSIVVRNKTFTNQYGETYTMDVRYRYDSGTDRWLATEYYTGGYGYIDGGGDPPAEFILTRAQVKAMKPDSKTNNLPLKGKIYDGKKVAGTAFTNVAVTGITLNKTTATVAVDSSVDLKAVVSPSDATDKFVHWESSNTEVATVEGQGKIRGKKTGRCVITATTDDGCKKAKCVITVVKGTAITEDNVTITRKEYTYDGKLKTPGVAITVKGKKLVKGTDYTAEYESDRWTPGSHRIYISGKGLYSGSVTMFYYVNLTLPETASITFIPMKSGVTVSWKRVDGIDGYKLYYYNHSTGEYKSIYFEDPAVVRKTLKGFNSGDEVYFDLTTYREINGQKYFSVGRSKTVTIL